MKDEDNCRFLLVVLSHLNHKSISVTIRKEGCLFDSCTSCRTYMNVWPKDMNIKWLIIGTTKQIGDYVVLEHREDYIGESLRRSSASVLIEDGGDLLT